MAPHLTLLLMLRLLGLLAIVQSIEYLQLHQTWSNEGVWRWPDLKRELAGNSLIAQKLLGAVLGPQGFFGLNVLRILIGAACVLYPVAAFAPVLLFMHLLTLLRWRGSFNGGSDYMNLMLLSWVSAGLLFDHLDKVAFVCLWYICLQLLMSYYRSGYAKLRNRRWRSGEALKDFLSSKKYRQGAFLRWLIHKPTLFLPAAWLLMLFEISFPLSLLGPKWAAGYMAAGVVFHLNNSYALGLNRFFFAWLAAYPALYFCAF